MFASIHSWIYPDIQPVPEVTLGDHFGRIYIFEDQLVPIIVHQSAPGLPLVVKYKSDTTSRNVIKKKIAEIFGLNVQMEKALNIIAHDSRISHIISEVSGIQPYLSPTIFEALVKTMIQQQISYRSANILTKRMVLDLSENMFLEGIQLHSFPTHKDILECGTDGLRKFGLGYKADYIHSLTKSIETGELDIEQLRSMSYEEITDLLLPIKGIGKWTIRTLAIAGLGLFSIFPYDDLGVRNLMGKLFGNEEKRFSTDEVEEFAQQWGAEKARVLYLLMCADVLGLLGDQGRQQMHKRTSDKR